MEQKLPRADDLRTRMREHDEALYRLGSMYEAKGRLGKMIMRLTSRGRGKANLDSGRATYARHHYREEVIRAYNEEVIRSWSE